jgi:hypothetical protein
MADTLSTQIATLIRQANYIMDGNPSDAQSWRNVRRKLRTASDKAKRIQHLAERMEGSENSTDHKHAIATD